MSDERDALTLGRPASVQTIPTSYQAPKKRRFATALENDDPNRVIGIEEYAEIVGVSVSSIRRWSDPLNPYYDPRLIVRDHKKGRPYKWLRSDATTYRDIRLGVTR